MKSTLRRAFTLIELLVVVAIIALIIALILPALGRAKEQSRRTVCAANLKGIGLAINVYAEENNNRVPPFCRDLRDDGNIHDWYKFTWGYTQPYYGPWTTLLGASGAPGWSGPNNIGILLDLKLITNPHIFYCPSATWWEFQYPAPDRWVKFPPITAPIGAQTAFVATSYMYNPYPWARTGNITGYDLFPKYHTRAEFYENGKAIALDLVENWRKLEDTSHKTGGGGWNLLFIDSHVDFRTSAATRAKVLTGNPDSWTDMALMIDPLNNQ